jgi:LPXTG-site transpeptidase (sortase) family protein
MKLHRDKLRSSVENLLILLGAIGLVVAGLVYADAWLGSRRAVAEFKAQQLEPIAPPTPETSPTNDAALALLSIARLELEVAIFSGTSKTTLNRGAGLVEGSSPPGTAGNIVISAHRDSYFRPLKDIRIGDVIELQLRDGIQRFKVDETFITDPLDVSVLEPTAQPTLTLITCYPFYYIGFAPDRFIVRAIQIDS